MEKRPNPITFFVKGSCLEGIGIEDGDTVFCDTHKRPKQPYQDIICFTKQGQTMIKQYAGVYGRSQWATTRYADGQKDDWFYIAEKECIGIVFAVYSADGSLKWIRDVTRHPETFHRKQTLEKEPPNVCWIQPIKSASPDGRPREAR